MLTHGPRPARRAMATDSASIWRVEVLTYPMALATGVHRRAASAPDEHSSTALHRRSVAHRRVSENLSCGGPRLFVFRQRFRLPITEHEEGGPQ